MATECPCKCKQRRSRRWLALLLLLFMGFSVPFGAYWLTERTERRLRAAERLLMEELASLRAEVAALAQQQALHQEAVGQLAVKTDALLDLWESQVDMLARADGPGSPEAAAVSGAEGIGTATVEAAGPAPAEAGGKEAIRNRDEPFWAVWWAGATYYAVKLGRYLPLLYQLGRLHPAIP